MEVSKSDSKANSAWGESNNNDKTLREEVLRLFDRLDLEITLLREWREQIYKINESVLKEGFIGEYLFFGSPFCTGFDGRCLVVSFVIRIIRIIRIIISCVFRRALRVIILSNGRARLWEKVPRATSVAKLFH